MGFFAKGKEGNERIYMLWPYLFWLIRLEVMAGDGNYASTAMPLTRVLLTCRESRKWLRNTQGFAANKKAL
jgi:hypothetical protein